MARLVAGIALEGHAGIGEWGAEQVLAAALLAPSAVAILEMERGRTASSGCAS